MANLSCQRFCHMLPSPSMERTLISDTVKKINKTVVLKCWINSIREHKNLIFLDLRDRTGLVQAVVNASNSSQAYEVAKELTPESCIEIAGKVNQRPKGLENAKLATGTVEIEVQELKIYSLSKTLPFPLDTNGYDVEEEIRLKYRYLDLRRKRLTQNIRFRSKFVELARKYLFENDFCEIETPLLTKSTPEGSRDFIVPSRMQPGKFYALPQSPQQYKQLLMVAGFERYFQIARCLRDEDLRADRGFEHTQVDIEMSFVEREDVMAMVEGLTISVVEALGGKILQKPFPVFTYDEMMKKFGADKFDLRSEEEKKQGLHAFAWVVDFPFFEKDKEGNWTFTHNPFSDPRPEDKEAFLNGEIAKIKTTQYDLVWNGSEAGGGSIRSTDPKILSKVFEVLGHSPQKIKEQFGHMMEAFSFGVPPHGGIALGIERWVMQFMGEKYLREVQAFAMTSNGKTSVMDAPSEISEKQLVESGLELVSKTQKDMPLFEKIKSNLDKGEIKYKVLEHKAVYTSEEAAKIRGTKISQGAKAIIMFGDKKPLMIVVPADKKIDFKKFKLSAKVKDLRMATAEEVKKITGVKIGAVPPFGNLIGVALYVDSGLAKEKEIVFNAGLHTKSILMGYDDFERITKPTIGDYTS